MAGSAKTGCEKAKRTEKAGSEKLATVDRQDATMSQISTRQRVRERNQSGLEEERGLL